MIHAVHSIYIHDMGALRKQLPLTWIFTLIAALSLMGVPPFPGFWSKDAILLATLEANRPLFLVALVTVGITAFYTVRFLGIVFSGTASQALRRLESEGVPITDGAPSMRVAAGLLTVFLIIAGIGGPYLEAVLHHGFEASLATEISSATAATPAVSGNLRRTGSFRPGLALFGRGRDPGLLPLRGAQGLSPGAHRPLRRDPVALHILPESVGDRCVLPARAGRRDHTAGARCRRCRGTVGPGHQPPVAVGVHGADSASLLRLRTDTEELVYNVSYVLVLFVLFLTFLLLGSSGGG